MNQEIKLEAQKRENETGKQIIAAGFIPAVVYGPNVTSQSIKVQKRDFEKAFAIAGETHFINLEIAGGKAIKVVVKDTQNDVIKNRTIHVDFLEVDMNKKIVVEIPLHFVGESRAVKELGAVMIKGAEEVEIECLPTDLEKSGVNYITVDISILKNIGDHIMMHDLVFPEGLKPTEEADKIIASVLALAKEAPVAAPVAAAAATPAAGAAAPAAKAGAKPAAPAKDAKK